MSNILPAVHLYNITKGVEAYARPGAVIVASSYTLPKPEVQAVRGAGAKVLLYVDPVEIVLGEVPLELAEYYQGTQLWPFLGPQGARVNYPGTVLADIRRGSPWAARVVSDAQRLMTLGNLCDGLYLDVVGSRLWSTLANWSAWPLWEQDAWADGCAALVQRIDYLRRCINPQFLLVNNNIWFDPSAEAAVDGVNLEHHAPQIGSSTWNYAARAFSPLGHRLVIATCLTTADALAWAKCPGITHVAAQPDYVSGAPAPVV